MGVKRGWMTWALGLGVVGVFLGERGFHDLTTVRAMLSGLGGMAVLAAVLAGMVVWLRSEGDEGRIARLFALAYLGAGIALVGFMVGTEDGVRWLGLAFESVTDESRFRRGFLVGSSIVMAVSLLPALAAQWAMSAGGGGQVAERHVDALRVIDSATAALNVALAGAFLMLAGYVAADRDWTLDASYFKTSSPGSAVEEIAAAMEQPLRVLLFFPPVDQVKDEVARYFRSLDAATGNVVVEEYDRLTEPLIAEEFGVTVDGTVVLVAGDRVETLYLPLDLDQARGRLRVFDSEAQQALLMLTRDRRVIYLTTGHGELNDPFTLGRGADLGRTPEGEVSLPLGALRSVLGLLNYEVRDIGVGRGLARSIPDDAAAVFVIGPEREFLAEEIDVLDRYLEAGGSVMLAVEADSDFQLGRLRDRLGVDFSPEPLVDDQRHMRQRGGASDRRLLVTDRVSFHPSVATASRRGAGTGVLISGARHLTRAEPVEGARVTFTIQSLPTSFADLNGNLQFDSGEESRGSRELAAAVEGTGPAGSTTMRALLYADADLFSDEVLSRLALNMSVVADGVRWLGREEAFAGETSSEADVPMVHTRSEDVAWFYAIILGAPLLLLAIGVAVYMARGRRPRVRA